MVEQGQVTEQGDTWCVLAPALCKWEGTEQYLLWLHVRFICLLL